MRGRKENRNQEERQREGTIKESIGQDCYRTLWTLTIFILFYFIFLILYRLWLGLGFIIFCSLFYFVLFLIFRSRVRVYHDVTHQSQSYNHVSHRI